jgi:hypothetical protein
VDDDAASAMIIMMIKISALSPPTVTVVTGTVTAR